MMDVTGGMAVSSYTLKVKIDPSSSRIESEIRIKHPPDSCFYLNENLEILRVIADGHTVSFQRDSSKYSPYTAGTATTINEDIGEELIVEYTGILTEAINGVNMIHSDLVELALYSAWYPMFKDDALFDFSLEADLPSGFVSVTNGKLEEHHELEGRNRTKWRSIKPGFDIVLLASPNLEKIVASQTTP